MPDVGTVPVLKPREVVALLMAHGFHQEGGMNPQTHIGVLEAAKAGDQEAEMSEEAPPAELLELLNQALARELQVSIQYMLQHAIGTGQASAASGKTQAAKQAKFLGSHFPYWLPGDRLKKVAITEMRHAESIAERVVSLGGEPVTQPDAIDLGKTTIEMLRNDRWLEQEAVELYGKIIEVAESVGDDVTTKLFQRILSDEEGHYRLFSELLGEA